MNLTDLQPGAILPNGAKVDAYFVTSNGDGVILAYTHDNEVATWNFYRGDLRSTSNGHYFTIDAEGEGYEEAEADMLQRIGRLL